MALALLRIAELDLKASKILFNTYLPGTHSLIEALCYYIPAKIMFGDVNKVISMPVVDKFHKLLTKLDSISFGKVIDVIRKPGCIIEKLMELGLFKK